ncbi:hypothetical protein AVEN_17599-1 [Araneus ventricosus]|uniref:Uncharacterized protein n=1 Tax=Araneus ventricosus TaxID=182803 RepID=A0A4Y2HWN1_ARAVE|nr:hypothetical protein AVEN_17599-1 [Araneus ventricosus]
MSAEVTDRILKVTPVQISAVAKSSSVNSDVSGETEFHKKLKLFRHEVKELRQSRSYSRNCSHSRLVKKYKDDSVKFVVVTIKNLLLRHENVFSPVLFRKIFSGRSNGDISLAFNFPSPFRSRSEKKHSFSC